MTSLERIPCERSVSTSQKSRLQQLLLGKRLTGRSTGARAAKFVWCPSVFGARPVNSIVRCSNPGGGYRSTIERAQDGSTGWANLALHTAGGERHGCLYHWSTAVGTSGDGLGRGISPEDGRPDRQTRWQGGDRGQRPAGPDGPGRGGEAAPLRRRLGVPVARACPSLSQRPGLRAAATGAPGQHCHGGLCRRARVSPSRRGRLASVLRHVVGCPPGMTSLLLHTTRDGGSQRMRIPREQFRSLSLEVHGILSDVPLHDVTAVDLPGGGAGRTILDVRAPLARENVRAANPMVRGLFALRALLGRLFGWDSDMYIHQETSSIHRLSSDIKRRSALTPGALDGPFRVLYVLERESLAEVRNATVHAFLASVLTETPCGYGRTRRCSRRRPRFWFVGIHCLAARPPLLSSFVRQRGQRDQE